MLPDGKLMLAEYGWATGERREELRQLARMFFATRYELVAIYRSSVEDTGDITNHLEKAYSKTQHIGEDWRDNEGFHFLPARPVLVRSTSIGDIMQVGDALYIVEPIGYSKL